MTKYYDRKTKKHVMTCNFFGWGSDHECWEYKDGFLRLYYKKYSTSHPKPMVKIWYNKEGKVTSKVCHAETGERIDCEGLE